MRMQGKKSGLIIMFKERFWVGFLACGTEWKQMDYRPTK